MSVLVLVLVLVAALSAGVGLAVLKQRKELPRCLLLAEGDEGRELFKARRDLKRGGVLYKGVLYPDELLNNLGYSTFELVDEVEMPEDGDTRHDGSWPALLPVGQRVYRATWAQFHTARVRLNWSSIFDRGNGNLAVLKNVGIGVIVLVNLYMGMTLQGLRSETGQLRTNLVVVSGQLARLTGVGSTNVPVGSVANPNDHSLVPPVPTATIVPTPAGGLPAGDPGRKP